MFKCILGVGDTVAIDEVLGEIETDKVGNFKVFYLGCVKNFKVLYQGCGWAA